MPARRVRRPAALPVLAVVITAFLAASCQRTDDSAGPGAAPPQIIKTKTGIEMVQVPAGSFTMGSDRGKPDESPAHKVWVGAFLMDIHEVTQADYYKTSPEKNPRGPTAGKRYVLRGGAWNSSADACRAAYRVAENPGFQDACFALDAIGFRCVRRASAGGD